MTRSARAASSDERPTENHRPTTNTVEKSPRRATTVQTSHLLRCMSPLLAQLGLLWRCSKSATIRGTPDMLLTWSRGQLVTQSGFAAKERLYGSSDSLIPQNMALTSLVHAL